MICVEFIDKSRLSVYIHHFTALTEQLPMSFEGREGRSQKAGSEIYVAVHT